MTLPDELIDRLLRSPSSPPHAFPPDDLVGNAALASSPNVVLVDDEDLFRESLSLDLIDAGYEVTSFSSDGALEYFDAGGTADVVLLDWRVRRVNGIDVLRSLRRAVGR